MQSKLLLAITLCLAILSGCSKPEPPTINLYRAVHIGDIDQIRRNLYWHAEVNKPGPDGLTPLHVAARKGSLVVIKLLLQHGADIEAKDRRGNTPLASALLARNTLVADYLVKQGAKLDANALLDLTVRQGKADRDVIDFLVKQGADLDASNDQGNPPLHQAIIGGYRVVAKYLIKKGADINARNRDGKTPLQLARELQRQDIERMLRQYGAVSGSMDAADQRP